MGGGGVAIGLGKIMPGQPHKDIALDVVAEARCTQGVHGCVFRVGGTRFRVSLESLHHFVPGELAGKLTVFEAEGRAPLTVDARQYNSFVVANELVVSTKLAGLTVWRNETHAVLYSQPNVLNSMQDVVSILFMVIGLTAIIDISRETSRSMMLDWRNGEKTREMDIRDVHKLSCALMFDMAFTAAFIVMMRLYHDMHFVDTHMHGVRMRFKWMKNTVAAVVVVSATAVVTIVVADKWLMHKFGKHGILAAKHTWWVWCRCSYETAVMLAICSASPFIVGEQFVLAVRFTMGIVLCIVNGRDGWYVAQEAWEHFVVSRWQLGGLLVVTATQGLLTLFLVATVLFEPVFLLSQSFPDTDEFIASLSAICVVIAACFGASIIQIYHHVKPLAVVSETRRAQSSVNGWKSML